jgi:tRNA G10  N-methylase Trm11
MPQYISSFTTGFGAIIEKAAKKHLKGNFKLINLYDTLIHYEYDRSPFDLTKIPCFNNVFFVIKNFTEDNLNFEDMVKSKIDNKITLPINKGRFRVKFSRFSQFEAVDKSLSYFAEKIITDISDLKVHRTLPDTEIWYVIRSENVGFLVQLLKKRAFTEKNLHKGELRPEFAYLMALYADINPKDVVCDPFAGYGSIPKVVDKHFGCKNFFIIDNDKSKINKLLETFAKKNNYIIKVADALDLKSSLSHPVDKIITDPPWGIYEEFADTVSFYHKILASFKNVLSENGIMVMLFSRKNRFEDAVEESKVEILERIDTLVNGKKATLYKTRFLKE